MFSINYINFVSSLQKCKIIKLCYCYFVEIFNNFRLSMFQSIKYHMHSIHHQNVQFFCRDKSLSARFKNVSLVKREHKLKKSSRNDNQQSIGLHQRTSLELGIDWINDDFFSITLIKIRRHVSQRMCFKIVTPHKFIERSLLVVCVACSQQAQ